MKNEYYQNNYEHLYDELLLIDLLLHAQVIKFRQAAGAPQNALQGLYISEAEIDSIIEKGGSSEWANKMPEPGTAYDKLAAAIRNLNTNIRSKIEKSRQQGITLKLVKITELYQLSSFEVNVFCICLASQFSSSYSTLFAYLQNDVTRKQPSIELILNLLCQTFEEKIQARHYFSTQSTLFKNNILYYSENTLQQQKFDITAAIKVNNRILGYILDNQFIDDDISLLSEIYKSGERLDDIVLPADIKEKLHNFMTYYKTVAVSGNFVFSFHGPAGSQKVEAAAALCAELGLALLVCDVSALHNADIYFERGIDLLLRESIIIPAAVYLKNCDFIFTGTESDPYLKRYLLSEIDKTARLTFIDSEEPLPIHGEFRKQQYISLLFPIPDYILRRKIWEHYLSGYLIAKNVDIRELAGKYNLTYGQIRDIAATAGTYALWRTPQEAVITQQDLQEASRLHSNQKLNDLAQRIQPHHRWSDIVLSPDIKEKLVRLENMFKYKHKVFTEWGFDNKLSLGKGISALFYGDPGTGKTLACEIIAYELGMDLYKIDISTVVSKYIGETEKNLKRIFTEAECSNAILFFDEADAIFGKRTEITDAHDRYANIEVSYLLQQIDEYNGVVILATNFIQNIDKAFERRLHFSVNFPFPDEKFRLQIWKNIFPAAVPLAEKMDYVFMAKKFDITGGHIKNIALAAAFYAATDNKPVSMSYLLQACKAEYEKIGRLWNENDFAYPRG